MVNFEESAREVKYMALSNLYAITHAPNVVDQIFAEFTTDEILSYEDNAGIIYLTLKKYPSSFNEAPEDKQIYLLNELKNKEEILDFFEIVNRKIEVSYTSCSSFEDIKNNSQVQEKVLQAIYDIKANVNSVLVLEKFLFSLVFDDNKLDFLGD